VEVLKDGLDPVRAQRGQGLRHGLEGDGPDVRQPGQDLGQERQQLAVRAADMSVEVEAGGFEPAGDMDLQDAFEGEFGQHVAYRFTPVALVGEQVVQVEEDGAVAAIRHGRDEGPVGKLARPRLQVADTGLDQERQGRGGVVGGRVTGRGVHPRPGLRGRQQESRVDAGPVHRRPVEGQVLAPVRGAQAPGAERGQRHAGRLGGLAAAHREPHAVRDNRHPEIFGPAERVLDEVPAGARPGRPHGLRLDLDEVGQVPDVVPDQVQPGRDDEPHAEIKPRPPHGSVRGQPAGQPGGEHGLNLARFVGHEVRERLPLDVQARGASRASGLLEDALQGLLEGLQVIEDRGRRAHAD
jgi:hypothetical protein